MTTMRNPHEQICAAKQVASKYRFIANAIENRHPEMAQVIRDFVRDLLLALRETDCGD